MVCKGCGKDAYNIRVRYVEGLSVETCNNCSDRQEGDYPYDLDEVKAIWKSPDGTPIATNRKGNIIDKKDNPYVNDARGWKRAGHKYAYGKSSSKTFI